MSLTRHGDEQIEQLRGEWRIIQSAAAPRFSLDAVLLAYFAPVQAGQRVVDLGCGSGILPLLLLSKQPQLNIRAVELMPTMAELAARNMELNQVADRVQIIQADIRQEAAGLAAASAELVLSNPPYYRQGAGRISTDELLAAARSEQYCTLSQLVSAAAHVLAPLGRLCLVHRAARLADLVAELSRRCLRLSRIRPVQPFANQDANLVLLEAVRNGKADCRILPPLIIYEKPGCYSAEMESIYAGNTVPGSHADR